MKNLILRYSAAALVVFAALLGAGGGLAAKGKAQPDGGGRPAGWPEELIICNLPTENSDAMMEARGMLEQEMGEALGLKVREINVADYNAVVEAMRTKHADIGGFGPVSYVQAAERAGAAALVVAAPMGDKKLAGYTSMFIVKPGSPIKNLQDLRGKTFAYVDPSSTSGNYVPTLELMNAFPGMTNEDFHTNGVFFASVTFSGKHYNSIQAVINGDVDAAAVASNTLRTELENGRVKKEDYVVIHESPMIPNSPVAIRSDLPADLRAAVKQFYLNYKNPVYFQVLQGLPPDQKPAYIEAGDRDYDYVRDLMAKVIPQ
jgi:phosphonate transport system substrate-binding protein